MRQFLLAFVLVAPAALAQRGVPQNGFPTWQERTVQVLVNRTRAAPTVDPKACSNNTASAPLTWAYPLNRSARFHSTNMQKSGQFMHNSPCVLASNLGTTFTPGTTCDGAAACACSTGAITCTRAQNDASGCTAGTFSNLTDRLSRFSVATGVGWAENIIYGYGGPRASHDGWMASSGHCTNILGNYTHLGVGHFPTSNYFTENFTRQSGFSPQGTLIAGSHEPQLSGGAVEFRVNYFDAAGGPTEAQLNLDGTCSAMSLERGTQTNGTWLSTQTLSGTTCRRYFFTFTAPGGAVVHLPESGSYGVGGSVATCPDWSAAAPATCPVSGNASPTIATAAGAAPSPVSGTTTVLSALGADDGGEGALTYTWAATSGPAAVTYSANASNGAKSSTATFTRAGSYTFTVTVRDAQGATATSTVSVTVQQTATALTVTPASATLAPSGAQSFSGALVDQFGQAMTATLTWAVSGGGSISTGGVFSAGATPGGPFTVTASAGSVMGTAQVSVAAGTPPTVATAASATPSPVTGTTTALLVLGADDGGEAALTYSWVATGPAAVTFSANATNGAKSSTATFTRAGSYDFTVTVTDGTGLTVTSTVTVVVQARPTTVAVAPASASVMAGATQAFTAAVSDQFGQAMAGAAVTWAVSGGGTISSAGVFTAGGAAGGPFTATASAGTASGTAQLTVTAPPPPALTVQLTAPQANATVMGVVTLSASTNADARVTSMAFLVDGVTVSTSTSPPFTGAWNTDLFTEGTHQLAARATDSVGPAVTSATVTVTVTRAVTGDTTPPVVSLDSPMGTVTGVAELRATATDDVGVVEVVFELDGSQAVALLQAPWAHDVPAEELTPGTHQVRVTARDAAGNTATAEGSFEVPDPGAPQPMDLAEPVLGGCGCGSGDALSGLGVLLGAWLRRRRATRR